MALVWTTRASPPKYSAATKAASLDDCLSTWPEAALASRRPAAAKATDRIVCLIM